MLRLYSVFLLKTTPKATVLKEEKLAKDVL